jgi:hypothetical protein
MSAACEANPSKARRTPERAGRSQGPKGASASDGGGRHPECARNAARSEAARRRANETRPTRGNHKWRQRHKEDEE